MTSVKFARQTMKKPPVDAGLSPLKNTPLFRELPERHQFALAGISVARTFRRNEFIFRQGSPSAGFYVIQSGTVNVHRVSRDGAERIIRIFHAGESFAEASMLPGGAYPANARAMSESCVTLIPKAPFLSLLKSDADFGLRMIVALSLRIHALAGVIEDLRIENMRERLIRWLLSRRPPAANPVSYAIYLDTSKSALAAELGMRHETLSRHLAGLRESGDLSVNGREIVVLHPERMQNLLDETAS